MLTGLWTIGIKVPDIEKELAFHLALGNEIVLDETLEIDGEKIRLPLLKMGDKYVHLAEKMLYEKRLSTPLPFGICHLVYKSNRFDDDVAAALTGGAMLLGEVARIKAGFGERRVAFMMAPGGWIVEFIEIITNLVPEV
jgi:hypothetical protein